MYNKNKLNKISYSFKSLPKLMCVSDQQTSGKASKIINMSWQGNNLPPPLKNPKQFQKIKQKTINQQK